MENKISIQRGLTKLKLEIAGQHQAMSDKVYGGIYFGNKNALDGSDVEENKKKYAANFQSDEDRTTNIFNIKSAIAKANLENMIEVPELGSVSVNDAIIYKQTMLPLLSNRLEAYRKQYSRVLTEYNKMTSNWEERRDNIMQSESESKAELLKILDKEKPTIVFDTSHMEKLDRLVKFLRDELDITLSEFNARTDIVLP